MAKIGKRGKDLAIRIPKALVQRYGLKVGDFIDSVHLAKALADLQVQKSTAKQENDPA